jgi:hypothetical protein
MHGLWRSIKEEEEILLVSIELDELSETAVDVGVGVVGEHLVLRLEDVHGVLHTHLKSHT